MTKRRTFLILTALFTLLFIALVTLGAYLLSIQSKQFAVSAFLFAFGAVFGQVACLGFFVREHTRTKVMRKQQNQSR